MPPKRVGHSVVNCGAVRWVLLVSILLSALPVQPAAAASSGEGERLLAPNGVPMFITGMNYEGPADRAWQMWDPDKFDAGAIEADFKRASEQAGVNVLRLFVQPALLTNIAQNKFAHLCFSKNTPRLIQFGSIHIKSRYPASWNR